MNDKPEKKEPVEWATFEALAPCEKCGNKIFEKLGETWDYPPDGDYRPIQSEYACVNCGELRFVEVKS